MANSRINFFYSSGRCYGALFRVRGRMHLVGICTRGIFWRIGGRVFSPVPGYWESMFGIQYTIGARNTTGTGIRVLLNWGMRDERILIRVRPGGIRGAIYFSRTGCISIQLAELDTEIFSPLDYCNYTNGTKNKMEDIRGDENIEREHQMVQDSNW